MLTRRLTLRRETLAALTDDEMTAVAGGALPTTPVTQCPLDTWRLCLTNGDTCVNCLPL